MKMMKLNLILFMFFLNYAQCRAENIYYKDGTTASAKVVSRTKNTLWIKQGPGSVGVDVKNIEKIENDDDSISKYDVDYLSGQIQELVKQKDYAGAQKICSILLGVSPGDIEIRYLRGLLDQRVGNTQEAIEDYNFLINHNAADGRVLNNLGVIYAGQKRRESAMTMFNSAIEKEGARPESHDNLAELFMEMKDFSRAIDEYNKVIELEPNNAQALFNLGVAYKNKGDSAMAQEQWEKVLNVKPEDTDAISALEYLKKGGQ